MNGHPAHLERRSAPRYRLAAPVCFEGGTGVTRDVSATGLFFETTVPIEAEQRLSLSISISHPGPGGALGLTCHGRVRRVERPEAQGGREAMLGVAVAVDAVDFESDRR